MEQLKKALYLDDVRTPTTTIPGYEDWVVVRNYNQFIAYITENGLPDLISFDHDLGPEHMKDYFDQVAKMGWQSPDYDSYKDKTGFDCAKFMCDWIKNHNIQKVPICTVHSHNPVGSSNIESYISGFFKHCQLDGLCYQQRHAFKIEDNI